MTTLNSLVSWAVRSNRIEQPVPSKVVNTNSPAGKTTLVKPKRRYSQITSCPICMDELKYEVEADCGHRFCCYCLVDYWAFKNFSKAIKCPFCRGKIKMLFQYFSEAELNAPNRKEAKKVANLLGKIKIYNSRFSGEPRTFLEIAYAVRRTTWYRLKELFSI